MLRQGQKLPKFLYARPSLRFFSLLYFFLFGLVGPRMFAVGTRCLRSRARRVVDSKIGPTNKGGRLE